MSSLGGRTVFLNVKRVSQRRIDEMLSDRNRHHAVDAVRNIGFNHHRARRLQRVAFANMPREEREADIGVVQPSRRTNPHMPTGSSVSFSATRHKL